MPEVWFAVPGDPETRTGGYIYAKRLTQSLIARGWIVHAVRLPASFPRPSAEDLAETRRLLETIPPGTTVLVDGLAFGAFTPDVLAGLRCRVVALVHHPLALETGLSADDAESFAQRERTALSAARGVVVTSQHTADILAADYGVAWNRITVAVPGADPRPRAQGRSRKPCLLTVATVTPRKGHAVLVSALSLLADLPWTSVIAGSLDRSPETVAALRGQIAHSGVADRITLTGEVSDAALTHLYSGADIFVLPSRYEGYGMVFADALASGLPIVACAAGAVTDTVPADASLLVPVNNPAALAAALRNVLTDAPLRARLAEAAWTAGGRLPTWDATGAAVAAIVAQALSA